jgi:hypothetical protein
MFGPKTASGWGTGITLVGAPGTAGSTLLSGESAPTLAVGKIGDFYIDSNSMTLYGPKNSTSWGKSVSLGASTATAAATANVKVLTNSKTSAVVGAIKTYKSLTASDLKVLKSVVPTTAKALTVSIYVPASKQSATIAKTHANLLQTALKAIAPKAKVQIKIVGSTPNAACKATQNNCVVIKK